MRVALKPGRDFSVRAGHPWIFSGAIAAVEGEGEAGTPVEVRAADGRVLGFGTWNARTSIAVRMMTRGPRPIDAALVAERLASAVRLRTLVSDTDALRLVNGEGDGFPGLVIDRYGEFAICQFITAGADALKALVIDALSTVVPLRGIYERSEGNVRTAEGLARRVGVLAGEEPPPELVITESGRRHVVDVRGGQKTGFFLDQRANRDLVGTLAAGRRVLNLFAYSGGFSIAAARGGAVHVTSVDSSATALGQAEAAWRLNALDAAAGTFVRADVFEYLRGDLPASDLIVLDPPPFARRRVDRERARAGYKDVNLRAFRIAAPGALLLTFSCSQHVELDDWKGAVTSAATDAGRTCQLLTRLGPGIDHPQALAHPEGRYLKVPPTASRLMDQLAKTIASYGLWGLILVTCPVLFVVAFLIWLVTFPFDRRLRLLHLYSCWWASIYTYVFPYWRTSVRNRERLRSDTAYVVVSNHQSLLDILVLFRLYRHFKWVSKAEIFRLPFIGWNMALNRYIRIRRGDPKDAARMMAACGEALDTGSSIMIFPEGTRSLDGELRDFKHGAFTLALRHKVPILPIVLDGTLDALPKHGVTSPGADIVIQVLDPIPVDGFADVDALRHHVRGVMADTLRALRIQRLGSSVLPAARRSA